MYGLCYVSIYCSCLYYSCSLARSLDCLRNHTQGFTSTGLGVSGCQFLQRRSSAPRPGRPPSPADLGNCRGSRGLHGEPHPPLPSSTPPSFDQDQFGGGGTIAATASSAVFRGRRRHGGTAEEREWRREEKALSVEWLTAE